MSRIQVLLTKISQTCQTICDIKRSNKSNSIATKLSKPSRDPPHNHNSVLSDIRDTRDLHGADYEYNTSILTSDPHNSPDKTPPHEEHRSHAPLSSALPSLAEFHTSPPLSSPPPSERTSLSDASRKEDISEGGMGAGKYDCAELEERGLEEEEGCRCPRTS